MAYSLFIDDERYPSYEVPIGSRWVAVTNMADAIRYIEAAGYPHYISFDHDLGEDEPTGYDFAKWLINMDMEHDVLPEEFNYFVHSKNPIGAENIKRLLDNYIAHKKLNKINSL